MDRSITQPMLPMSIQPDVRSLSPEFRLILMLLSQNPEDSPLDVVDSSISQEIHWDQFRWCVVRHRVAPALHARLSTGDKTVVPDEVADWLKSSCRNSALASLLHARRLVTLLGFLNENGVRALPFKGVCLAQQVFGCLESRDPGDIDILVAPEDLETVESLLCSHGYRCERFTLEPTRLQRKKIRELAHGLEYVDREKGIHLDLHWRLFANRSLFRVWFSTLWAEGDTVDVLGWKVRTLSLEHTLLYLLAHGSSEGWSHLFRIVDIAEIFRKDLQLDWDAVVSKATRTGISRHMAVGLILAHGLLGSHLPVSVADWVRKQHISPQLISYCLKSMTSRHGVPLSLAENIGLVRYRIKLSPKMGYKWEIIWNMSHHAPDWEAVPLPDVLFPMYYLLRPLLWLNRRMTGIRGSTMEM